MCRTRVALQRWSTQNASAAFQWAFDHALSLRAAGIVFAPPGTYLIGTTLRIHRGTTLEGKGAELALTTPGIALLQHEIVGGSGELSRGLVIRDISFRVDTLKPNAGTTGLELVGRARPCNGQPICLGFASDYLFEKLTFTGFTNGFRIHPETSALDNTNMMIDSVGVRDLVFRDNQLALELQSVKNSGIPFHPGALKYLAEKGVKVE